MNSLDMIGLVDAMEKRLFARVDLADADYAAVVEAKLERAAFESIGQDLRKAPEEPGVAWLIRRVARLEARVQALSLALHSGPKASAPAAPVEPEQAVVLMDEEVVHNGFFKAERTATGAAFRWLGPSPVGRVYLPKLAPPVDVRLVVAAAYKGVQLEAVRIALNDGAWSPVEVERVGASIALVGRPAPGSDGEGLLHHIDIDCGATFCPADDGGDDRRRLGIALSRIELVRR